MNYKKANWLFITFFLFEGAMVLGMFLLSRFIHLELGMAEVLFLTECFFWIPCVIFLVATKTNPITFLRFKKIKISTVFKVVLYTLLLFPVTSFLNSLTLLFTDNALMEISTEVLAMPFVITFLLMAVYGPFVEEIAFRGMLFHSYKKSGNTIKAILLSSFLFGLAHLNVNQFAYALVIGLFMALLVEATGSIWSSILFHIIFNGISIVNLYLTQGLLSQEYMSESQALLEQKGTLFAMISLLAVITMVCIPLIFCVLVWIAKGEGYTDTLRKLKPEFQAVKVKLVTIPLIIVIIAGIGYMIYYL